MLQTIRRFALELLESAGEADARRRHALHFVELAGSDALSDLTLLKADAANLHAALEWAQMEGADEAELSLLAAVGAYWWTHGGIAPAHSARLTWASGASSHSEPLARTDATIWCALLAVREGNGASAASLLRQADRLAENLGDRRRRARVLLGTAYLALSRGHVRHARNAAQEALAITEAEGSPFWSGLALEYLGLSNLLENAPHAARPLLEQAVDSFASFDRACHHYVAAVTFLAAAAMLSDDVARAADLLRAGLAQANTVEDALTRFTLCATAAHLIARCGRPETGSDVLLQLNSVTPQRGISTSCPELAVAMRVLKDAPLVDQPARVAVPLALDHILEVCRAEVAVISQPRSEVPAPGIGGVSTPTLSKRELQVVELLAEGLSDADIARRLIMTPRTAQYHVASILHKLGASNRTHAVVIALRRQLLFLRDSLLDIQP